MRKIKLTQGNFALVDDEDFELLNQRKWAASASGLRRTLYATSSCYDKITKKKWQIKMHRVIMGLTDPKILVDHINQNTLDNRRSNLRTSTKAQNGCNRGIPVNNTSGYKGVYYQKSGVRPKPWYVYIIIGRKGFGHYRKFIGYYATKEEAALAYNKAAIDHFGEFAWLNTIL